MRFARRNSRLRLLAPVLAVLALAGCARRKPLPVLGAIPHFELTSHTGEVFDSRTLDGCVWVADFIFTNCNGPCPRMSGQMRQIQDRLADVPDARFVSFTVDPARDTPQTLAAYAKRNGARDGFWFFLTGEREKLHDLCRFQFKIGNVDGTLDHSTRFVLVDGGGRIRGYYGSFDGDMVSRIVEDVRHLAGGES
jgi:protein SCO1/2